MLQQTAIPKTPEEVAACLGQMTEKEQCIIKGFIIGMNAQQRLTMDHAPRPESRN